MKKTFFHLIIAFSFVFLSCTNSNDKSHSEKSLDLTQRPPSTSPSPSTSPIDAITAKWNQSAKEPWLPSSPRVLKWSLGESVLSVDSKAPYGNVFATVIAGIVYKISIPNLPASETCGADYGSLGYDVLAILSSPHCTYQTDSTTTMVPKDFSTDPTVRLKIYKILYEKRSTATELSSINANVPISAILISQTELGKLSLGSFSTLLDIKLIPTSDNSLFAAWPELVTENGVLMKKIKLVKIKEDKTVHVLPDLKLEKAISEKSNRQLKGFDFIKDSTTGEIYFSLGSETTNRMSMAIIKPNATDYDTLLVKSSVLPLEDKFMDILNAHLEITGTRQAALAYDKGRKKVLLLHSSNFGYRIYEVSRDLTSHKIVEWNVDDPNIAVFRVSSPFADGHSPQIYVTYSYRTLYGVTNTHLVKYGAQGERQDIFAMASDNLIYNYLNTQTENVWSYSLQFGPRYYRPSAYFQEPTGSGKLVTSFALFPSLWLDIWTAACRFNSSNVATDLRAGNCKQLLAH